MAQIGQVGLPFTVTFLNESDDSVIDISGATVKQIIFSKPDGTKLTKNGVYVTDGTDGKLRYVSIAGDLDVSGVWELQGYYEKSGTIAHTSIDKFSVERNL